MSKKDRVGYYDKVTGEELPDDVLSSIKREENSRLLFIYKDNPYKLSLDELELVIKIKHLKQVDKLPRMSKLRYINEDFENKLFETGISPTTYYYFKKLVSKYCSKTHTLLFRNHKPIRKDLDIEKLLEVSKPTWTKCKKELEELNILRKLEFDGENYYKVNPVYVGKRNSYLTTNTYYFFRKDLMEYLERHQIIYFDLMLREEFGIDMSKEYFTKLN